MVEDPDGEGHVLKMGSKLGKNGGRVTRIFSKGIRVIEVEHNWAETVCTNRYHLTRRRQHARF